MMLFKECTGGKVTFFLDCTTRISSSDRRCLMVWCAISVSEKSQLVILRKNLTAQKLSLMTVCSKIVFNSLIGVTMPLQHDNAKSQAADYCMLYGSIKPEEHRRAILAVHGT